MHGEILGGGIMLFRQPAVITIDDLTYAHACIKRGLLPYQPELDGIGFKFRSLPVAPNRFGIVPWEEAAQRWSARLLDALQHYCYAFPEAIPTLWWTFPGHLLAYREMQHIGWHTDDVIANRAGSHFSMHLTVTSLLYLNDDYVGGEIEFKYPAISLKPRAGDIVVYPSNYMGTHQVQPVCDGLRMAFTQFYGYGQPFGVDMANLKPLTLSKTPTT